MTDKMRQIISATFILSFFLTLLSPIIDRVHSDDIDKILIFANEIGFKTEYNTNGTLGVLIYFALLGPVLSASAYFFNVKFSEFVFFCTFPLLVASPLVFNFGGVDVYSSAEVFFEGVANAAGGALCLHILHIHFSKLSRIEGGGHAGA